ncbi:acyltransferase [Streptomyces sp. T028]|uniref:acyltransferase n=1 Tax=Streptomyces sp. T028 TaxID=3394379 RepID=UPI003A89DA21
MSYTIKPTAQVDESAELGDGTTVWELAQVREKARLGTGCVIGRGAYVGTGVRIGDNVKLQNYALVYEPAELGDGVFVGPAVVLTNDQYPRSVDPEGKLKRGGDWEAVGVKVAEGASLGARSVCVAPVRVGRWALVAAGAVVTKDVPDFALVAGVPARRIGWVGRAGVRLVEREGEAGVWECPQTGTRYGERTADGATELVELPAAQTPAG